MRKITEQRRQYQREWNRGERRKAWATGDKNREYQREWHKAHRVANPDFAKRQSLSAQRWQQANPLRNAWNAYRGACGRKARTFALPMELFTDLVTDVCFYCGAMPAPINGIDRVDNTGGYEFGNVVTSCETCNKAKGKRTATEFQVWATRLAGHLPGWAGFTEKRG